MSIIYLSAVFLTLALAGCSAPNSRVVTALNTDAALSGSIPRNPLGWRAITSGVDARNSTMFTLFGNDTAIRDSRTGRNYSEGSALALVTWRQQEDSRWFGAKIPAEVNSVEFIDVITADDGRRANLYRGYQGSQLKETTGAKDQASRRVAFLLSLRAAVMP